LGYSCIGSPSVCTSSCGDAIKAFNEICDDGNLANNDGCSSACALEYGYACTGSPSVCASTCGDGQKAFNENCDDWTNDGIGCATGCISGPAAGYLCTYTYPNPSSCSTSCGNG